MSGDDAITKEVNVLLDDLRAWEHGFELEFGKQPSQSDISSRPTIAYRYQRLLRLQRKLQQLPKNTPSQEIAPSSVDSTDQDSAFELDPILSDYLGTFEDSSTQNIDISDSCPFQKSTQWIESSDHSQKPGATRNNGPTTFSSNMAEDLETKRTDPDSNIHGDITSMPAQDEPSVLKAERLRKRQFGSRRHASKLILSNNSSKRSTPQRRRSKPTLTPQKESRSDFIHYAKYPKEWNPFNQSLCLRRIPEVDISKVTQCSKGHPRDSTEVPIQGLYSSILERILKKYASRPLESEIDQELKAPEAADHLKPDQKSPTKPNIHIVVTNRLHTLNTNLLEDQGIILLSPFLSPGEQASTYETLLLRNHNTILIAHPDIVSSGEFVCLIRSCEFNVQNFIIDLWDTRDPSLSAFEPSLLSIQDVSSCLEVNHEIRLVWKEPPRDREVNGNRAERPQSISWANVKKLIVKTVEEQRMLLIIVPDDLNMINDAHQLVRACSEPTCFPNNVGSGIHSVEALVCIQTQSSINFLGRSAIFESPMAPGLTYESKHMCSVLYWTLPPSVGDFLHQIQLLEVSPSDVWFATDAAPPGWVSNHIQAEMQERSPIKKWILSLFAPSTIQMRRLDLRAQEQEFDIPQKTLKVFLRWLERWKLIRVVSMCCCVDAEIKRFIGESLVLDHQYGSGRSKRNKKTDEVELTTTTSNSPLSSIPSHDYGIGEPEKEGSGTEVSDRITVPLSIDAMEKEGSAITSMFKRTTEQVILSMFSLSKRGPRRDGTWCVPLDMFASHQNLTLTVVSSWILNLNKYAYKVCLKTPVTLIQITNSAAGDLDVLIDKIHSKMVKTAKLKYASLEAWASELGVSEYIMAAPCELSQIEKESIKNDLHELIRAHDMVSESPELLSARRLTRMLLGYSSPQFPSNLWQSKSGWGRWNKVKFSVIMRMADQLIRQKWGVSRA